MLCVDLSGVRYLSENEEWQVICAKIAKLQAKSWRITGETAKDWFNFRENSWIINEDIIGWCERGRKYEDVAAKMGENGVITKKLWRKQKNPDSAAPRAAGEHPFSPATRGRKPPRHVQNSPERVFQLGIASIFIPIIFITRKTTWNLHISSKYHS